MDIQEGWENVRVSDDSVTSCGVGLEQLGSGVRGSENLGVDLLEDLDSYLEDINDRLMISRMVSDSVIKGMVNAVEQEAAEKIAATESKVARLKESLPFLHVGRDQIESPGSPVILCEPESRNYGWYLSFTDACVEHDKMRESLGSLRHAAREQFKRLKKEIDGFKGSSSIRRINSGSELIGLGGILKEKEAESWVGVDRTVDNLKMTVDTLCTRVDDMLQLSKTSLCEWQLEQEFQGELEATVMQSSIRSLEEEFEEKLWDQNARFCGSQTVNWLEKFDEISSLRKDLDAILKLLPNSETGQLISYSSCDMEHSHQKTLSNPISFSTTLWEGNGKVDESKTGMPENIDAAQLEHLSRKELVNYFNNMITNIRRDHESIVLQKTEEYINLRGKYLSERGSSLPLRKDKEFEVMKKKIPGVILKLDEILVENENFPALSNNAESLGSLKDRLDSLLLENRQLKDSLTDKKKEVICLSSQISVVSEIMLQHSLAKANLLNLIGNLNAAMEDAYIEFSVTEEVYKCVLRELSGQIKCVDADSEMELIIMQDVYRIFFREASLNAEMTSKCETEDSDTELMVMQGLCEIIFRETIKDTEQELMELYSKYSIANENLISLEMKALEKENKLRFEVEENQRLNQEVLLLATSMEDKEKLAMEVSATLAKEKKQLELTSQELNNLIGHASRQQTLISEGSMELVLVKGKLEEALVQIKVNEAEINSINQKLDLAMEEIKAAYEQRKMLLVLIQDKQNDLLLFEAKEKEHMEQMEGVIVFGNWLLKTLADFECRVADDIKMNNLRLEHSRSQLSSLSKKANIFRRTGLLYKQRLERRCSDLQMAEAEVDLLGDEVDALLSLLEKIYIALDHYSPILQHYPGIIEILKLIRRELSGKYTKPV